MSVAKHFDGCLYLKQHWLTLQRACRLVDQPLYGFCIQVNCFAPLVVSNLYQLLEHTPNGVHPFCGVLRQMELFLGVLLFDGLQLFV